MCKESLQGVERLGPAGGWLGGSKAACRAGRLWHTAARAPHMCRLPCPCRFPADAPFWQRSLSGRSDGSSATAPLLGANGAAASSYKVV